MLYFFPNIEACEDWLDYLRDLDVRWFYLLFLNNSYAYLYLEPINHNFREKSINFQTEKFVMVHESMASFV